MQSVLIIGYVWPEPSSSAAGSRMMQLIRLFLDMGYKLTFATPAQPGEFRADLSVLEVEEVEIQVNDSSFDSFIKELNPSIVLFDRFMMEEQFGWRVAEHCPQAIRILDTEDLHSLRAARFTAYKEKRELNEKDLASGLAKREIASILRSDLSLIISRIEYDLLEEHYKIDTSLLCYLPFLIEPVPEVKFGSFPEFEERKHFISIGNFMHEPNWNAVLYLKEEIWKLIREQLPEAELHIYGAYTPPKAYQLHKPEEGFFIKGRAASVEEVMKKAKVCLAPLRFGAGLKGKLIDAMKHGTPNVTTSVGVEGMNDNSDWSGSIADDPRDFAKEAIKLYTDKTSWEKAQQKGSSILKRNYDPQKFAPVFTNKLKQLEEGLESHRLKNFTGSMLMHHHSFGTKYMAKWIEAKNRNKD
ncbi:glycosyltransferase [Leptobacterium flavescens]|uniref:Glycosyltransferase n=1 Tax=Leptobacterium flavescens TaxID=472055 RepID=A0A6P0UN88_9FLAO|nr:glycosyltransferase family 4 protein [Leptobacterium flavescens]NER14841.1 glycosyltransferase [Leptobacterium flavescens]